MFIIFNMHAVLYLALKEAVLWKLRAQTYIHLISFFPVSLIS